MEKQKLTGKPLSRLEAELKVTGKAKYAAEYELPDLLYGYVINSRIPAGKITAIDVSAAKALDGVVEIITHENSMKTAWLDLKHADMDAPPGQVFKPLKDDEIVYHGQPIGLVLANDFETARLAASLVRFTYKKSKFETDLLSNASKARKPKKGMATVLKPPPPDPQGDVEKAFRESAAKVEAKFFHGTEHHNPMELFATTVKFEGDGKLTIYDKTQGTVNSQFYVANVFGLAYKDVRVLAPFVGGGFGSGLRPQYQLYLSVMAALQLKRNVRVVLDRQQMFSFSHRPSTFQTTAFAATTEGRLTALKHQAIGETSLYEDYTENVVDWSHKLYPAPNTRFDYAITPLNIYSPLDMRAPGGCTGMHAIECTMDELAYQLNIDPLEFRLKNYAETDPSSGKPFTSKALRACYEQGAEKFGWSQRDPAPRSMKRGNRWVGYGMATGIWDALQFPSRVEMILTKDGELEMSNAVTDIGTGSFTVFTQLAADQMGLSMDQVHFNYGDSKKPFSMFQGGSAATASTSAGIVAAATALKKKLLKIAASADELRFDKLTLKEVDFEKGKLFRKDDRSVSISYSELVAVNQGKPVKVTKLGTPHLLKLRKYSAATHSAAFVEVEVDEELKQIQVTRALTAVAAGRIINPKTAGSQILGGMVWGISKALREETIMDNRLGKYINPNLAEYHIPVHADIHDLDVLFVEEKDEIINELGIKGVGEIGMVAIPAAISNAIFHATGKRLHNLPMHFDELL